MAEGVKYLHGKNLVHRDIKPDNILLSSADLTTATVKLADFGLFKVLRSPDVTHTPMVGSTLYSAPEVLLLLGHYGCKVDVWSYRVVAFELLTGTKPYRAPETEGLKRKQREGVPRVEGFPQGYEDICQDFLDFCLVFDPQLRPGWTKSSVIPFSTSLHISGLLST